jgi:HrpA-like RNA helicase
VLTPQDKQAEADQRRAKFFQPEGDHVTLLAVYEAWKHNKFSKTWCVENYLHARSLGRALDIRKQLVQIMDKYTPPSSRHPPSHFFFAVLVYAYTFRSGPALTCPRFRPS